MHTRIQHCHCKLHFGVVLCLYLCLSVSLSLSVCLSVSLFFCFCLCLSLSLSVSVSLSVCLSLCLSLSLLWSFLKIMSTPFTESFLFMSINYEWTMEAASLSSSPSSSSFCRINCRLLTTALLLLFYYDASDCNGMIIWQLSTQIVQLSADCLKRLNLKKIFSLFSPGLKPLYEDVPLVEFMHLAFTYMPVESYRRWLRSLLFVLVLRLASEN